jgi:Fungal hydrophobin.
MKLLISTTWISATLLAALPLALADQWDVRFPVSKYMTVQHAESICGVDAALACCDKAVYTHDISMAVHGETPSVIQNSLEGYQGSDGLGLFEGCHYIQSHCKLPALQRQTILTVFKTNQVLRIRTSQRSARGMLPVALQSLRYVYDTFLLNIL